MEKQVWVLKIGDVAAMPVQVKGSRWGSLNANLSGSRGDQCNNRIHFWFSVFLLWLSVSVLSLHERTWTYLSEDLDDFSDGQRCLEIRIMTCRREGWMNNGFCLNGKIQQNQLLTSTRKLIISTKTLIHVTVYRTTQKFTSTVTANRPISEFSSAE